MLPKFIPSRIVKADERNAYTAGFECGTEGANTTNCHFRHFAEERLTRSWELGKQHGEEVKATPTVVQS